MVIYSTSDLPPSCVTTSQPSHPHASPLDQTRAEGPPPLSAEQTQLPNCTKDGLQVGFQVKAYQGPMEMTSYICDIKPRLQPAANQLYDRGIHWARHRTTRRTKIDLKRPSRLENFALYPGLSNENKPRRYTGVLNNRPGTAYLGGLALEVYFLHSSSTGK
ncbi:hypothetical protein VFPPC_06672 [Pochonia chlamydosporia 170]|uniref:Uncharacterized protein n=1 Tax=Pochonia chlamydosporia 170 TaxID=1380566 RepID=A0A179F595_METCM|nr:hypothetical protein VFPPC_06672 [Pochonia chlamydosporia 170]OAQ60540.1 hypothetical protein VFPPC_06672 [Pochonia chlamydosporia 170]